jgi:hypothetical protein
MKYLIDYGPGYAVLYTPHPPERRFYELASTCFGIRKSIVTFRIIRQDKEPTPRGAQERLEFNGDVYIWREDGARKMLEPYLDDEWDTEYCEECCWEEGSMDGRV